MNYALQICPHANIKYAEALNRLALVELRCLMAALGLSAEPREEMLGGTPFMTFSTDAPLEDRALSFLCAHSSVYLVAQWEQGLLRPLLPDVSVYLKPDVAEILKYKGKTNTAFTMLMLNCALAASEFALSDAPLTVLDPICGKGTTLFCALRRGYHATGIDIDKRSMKESADFFEKYLQYHRIKHKRVETSLTLPKGKNAPKTVFSFTPEPMGAKHKALELALICADTAEAPALLSKSPVHLLVGDLPYGVQHAPKEPGSIRDFQTFLRQSLPGWYGALVKGGAMALAFNTFTLKRETLCDMLMDAGFLIPDTPCFQTFEHPVEQAVIRDMVIAQKR